MKKLLIALFLIPTILLGQVSVTLTKSRADTIVDNHKEVKLIDTTSIICFTDVKIPNVFWGHYIDNEDGDTFSAHVEVPSFTNGRNFELVKVTCDLHSVDAYELDEGDNILGVAAKKLLQENLSKTYFLIRYYGKNDAGNWVVDLFTNQGLDYSFRHILDREQLSTGKIGKQYPNTPTPVITINQSKNL